MDTRQRSRWLAPLGALVVLMGLLAAPALAQSDEVPVTEPAPAATDDAVPDPSAQELDVCVIEDYEPSAEELEEINAETAALVEFLADRGFAVEVETDDLGFTYPAFSEADEADEALWEAVDEFYADRYEDYAPSAEELEEINAETAALVEFLADRGFAVEVETDDLGFTYPAFSEADEADEALWEAVDEFYADRYEDFGAELFDDCAYELTDEDRAEIQAEIAGFIAELDEAGIPYELVTEDGIAYPEIAEEHFDALEELGLFDCPEDVDGGGTSEGHDTEAPDEDTGTDDSSAGDV